MPNCTALRAGVKSAQTSSRKNISKLLKMKTGNKENNSMINFFLIVGKKSEKILHLETKKHCPIMTSVERGKIALTENAA